MNGFYERIVCTALSQIMDVEVNPVNIAGVHIRYRLGTAEFSISLSAPYQLLLLNVPRGCLILSGVQEWERFRHLTDTWAANMPHCASLMSWAGRAVRMTRSCCLVVGGVPAPPAAPPHQSPAPIDKPKPLALPPPQTYHTKKAPHAQVHIIRIK